MNDTYQRNGLRDRENLNYAPAMSAASAEDMRTIMLNRVSWGAILAGVVVSLVVQLMLNLLGLGIGASSLTTAASADNPSAASLSIGAAIWWTVSALIAAYLGGVTAGRLSGKPKVGTAGWHGLTAWALTTLLVLYLLTTTIGSIVGGGFSALGSAAGIVGQGAGGIAQGAAQVAAPSIAKSSDPLGGIESRIRSASNAQDPAAMRDAATAAVRALLTGDPAQADAARTRAADALSKAQGISPDQAQAEIKDYEQQYRQAVDAAKQKAQQAAEVARKSVSRGSLIGFIALLLGGLAGWFGGRTGAVAPDLSARRSV